MEGNFARLLFVAAFFLSFSFLFSSFLLFFFSFFIFYFFFFFFLLLYFSQQQRLPAEEFIIINEPFEMIGSLGCLDLGGPSSRYISILIGSYINLKQI